MWRAVLLVAIVAGAGCSDDATSVLVRIERDGDFTADALLVRMDDRSARAQAEDEIRILLPDSLAGVSARLEMWGLAGSVHVAFGAVEFEPALHKELVVDLTLRDVTCDGFCEPDSTRCDESGVATCEVGDDGCTAWSSPVSCVSGTCTDGSCVDISCTVDSCTTPPEPTCVGSSQLRTYKGPGTCSDDTCEFTHIDAPCTNGCDDGACAPIRFTSVGVGVSHVCGVLSSGGVLCWGTNGDGESSPVVETAEAVTAGFGASCALGADNLVTCWGTNAYGQTSPPASTFEMIDFGIGFGCGARSTGDLQCWGHNTNGQATPPSGSFVAVSAGGLHACAVSMSGSVACWGASNAVAQLTPPSGTYAAVAVANATTCTLTTGGSVNCLGRNLDEDLDDRGPATSPTGTFRSISVDSFGCGVRTNGTLACWDTDSADESPPAGNDFVAVDVGGGFACARHADGRLTCWGKNTDGQTDVPE